MKNYDALYPKYIYFGLRLIDCMRIISSKIARESLKRANRSERAGRKTTGLTPGHRGRVAGLPSECRTSWSCIVRKADNLGG